MKPPQESRAVDVDNELASLAIVPRTVSPHLDALGEKAKDYARNARSRNTRRAHGRPPVQKEAIFADDLLAMLATLDNDLRGLRDRAILAIGFAGGLRRSEIVGLDCGFSQSEGGTGWIEIFGAAKAAGAAKNEGGDASSARNDDASDVSRAGNEGGLLLTINGKTGWREVEIGRGSSALTCPVAMLETWMRLGRVADGPLFRRVVRFPYDYFGLAIFGHQWKPALPLMASRWLPRGDPRAARRGDHGSTFDGVALVAEGGASLADDVVEFVDRRDVLVTMGSSTSAHSVSAGCSSGV